MLRAPPRAALPTHPDRQANTLADCIRRLRLVERVVIEDGHGHFWLVLPAAFASAGKVAAMTRDAGGAMALVRSAGDMAAQASATALSALFARLGIASVLADDPAPDTAKEATAPLPELCTEAAKDAAEIATLAIALAQVAGLPEQMLVCPCLGREGGACSAEALEAHPALGQLARLRIADHAALTEALARLQTP
ncbi:hypothetical protein [Paenirhodobacter populi]|uniref:Uncharacterized protein n=1 Tax=Paenirhodobacter populi TaxID=2306993 RepID=A0A443JIQ7_9RHOB|nr:hypothetical protein [Sinirhodobacter populi]RWR20479.1 hypothetical protein D2T30_11365 [Sinirhodobacter populi]